MVRPLHPPLAAAPGAGLRLRALGGNRKREGAGQPRLTGSWISRSINGNPAALRNHGDGLGQVQLQNAVVVSGGNGAFIDAGDIKGTAEGAVPALPADVGTLGVLLLLVLAVLGGDGEDTVLHIQLDVALVEPGQLGF